MYAEVNRFRELTFPGYRPLKNKILKILFFKKFY